MNRIAIIHEARRRLDATPTADPAQGLSRAAAAEHFIICGLLLAVAILDNRYTDGSWTR